MTTQLGIIGAGLMGGGIALDAARHGVHVRVYDARPESIAALRERANNVYARWVRNGRMSVDDAAAALHRLVPVSSLANLSGSNLLIEAIFEDLGAKRRLMESLAPHVSPEAIVASNTSALRVGAIADGFPFAGRVLGLHYFSPAEVSPLVEVVRAEKTEDETVARALTFLGETSRTPLHCTDTPGFAINRFFCPYYNEATRIVEDRLATPAEVDATARERLGVAAGPFAVMNLIRPIVAAQAMANLSSLGPFYRPTRLLMEQAERNQGWPLEEAAGLPGCAHEVERRLVGALAVPSLELASEQVADPGETDRGAVLALRFSRGPFALMRGYPPEVLRDAVKALCIRDGHPLRHMTLSEP